MSLETFEKTTGLLTAKDGTPLYYEVRGDGAPVVFIYGIACVMNHWHHQIRHFSGSMKTVLFDLRGHHKSQPLVTPDHLTMKDLGDDLIQVIEGLNLGPAHVIGHSFGAPVILEGYALRPDLFRSICFINGFAKNPIKGMFGLDVVEPFYQYVNAAYEQNPVLWSTLWRMAIDNPVSMRLAALAGGFNLHLTHFKDIEVYARGVGQMDLRIFLRLFDELMKFNGDSILPTINVPALIISGENDKVTPRKFQDDLRDLIPGAEFMLVPYGSHCTQLDFPDYVNMKLSEFWTATYQRRGA